MSKVRTRTTHILALEKNELELLVVSLVEELETLSPGFKAGLTQKNKDILTRLENKHNT